MFAGLVASAWAQEAPELRWEPILEIRQRFAYEDLDADSAGGDTSALSQRARLGLEVRRLGVSARVSFQDARRWTAGSPVVDDAFVPTIAEGWARVEGDLTRQVGGEVVIGRQPLTLHEGRLIGRDDFSLRGRFFDAVRVVARASPVDIEFVNARRIAEGDDPLGFGVNLVRVGASDENPRTEWTADAVWVVDARDTAETTSTAGMYLRLDTGRWRGRAEAYLQTSEAGTASLVGLSAGWVFGANERLVARVAYDLLSGDGSSGGVGPAAWQPVLGDSHHFNGLMDRFASAADSDDRGLSDLRVELSSRFAPQIGADVIVHRFWSPIDGGGLGTEVDAVAEWSFSPFAAARAGGAVFAPDPGFAATGATSRIFGYVELDVDF